MKSKWFLQKLNPLIPSWVSSIISPFHTLASGTNHSLQFSTYGLSHVEMSSLLSICGREGHLLIGSSLHASIIKNPEFLDFTNRNVLVVWNSLLSMYSKCGKFMDAANLFDHMPKRDTISWNSMLSSFLRNGELKMGFEYFRRMCFMGIYHLDHASLTTVLSACDGPEFLYINKMIHALVFLNGYERDVPVGNALITSYFKCGCAGSGMRVFDEMFGRNVITWTAAISGLAQNEFCDESLKLFAKMRTENVEANHLTYLSLLLACSGLRALKEGCQIHGLVYKLGIQSELCVESAIMDFYSKCGSMDEAWQIFESAEVFDEVSLTVILVGFAQNGFEEEAAQSFVRILRLGIEIDANIVSAVLGVFGTDTSLALGRQVHSVIIKKGFGSNPYVDNGLVNMYSKCGFVAESIKIFNEMSHRNVVSWNSMIAAFARHGNGARALQLYEEMRSQGFEPTDVTFLSLLHACSHVGLVDKGMEFLESMERVYGISPRMEHYASVVDMLGRAGLLNKAKSFIEGLPSQPSIIIWQALLGACSMHGDSGTGKYAADQLISAAPGSPTPYILMANIYSSEGRWKERARTIKKIKKLGVTKETGISWIEIHKKVHNFVVADQSHPEGESIYAVLLELFRHMRDEGYAAHAKIIPYHFQKYEKESAVSLTVATNSDISVRLEREDE